MPGLSPARGLSADDAGFVRMFLQTAVPFILAGGTAGGSANQFTMSDNGAISTLPTLPTTYSGGAWIYMPASGISAGSAAGWYWFVASSATAGTVYNNTYTSGLPTPPRTLTSFVTTGPGLVTQNTAAVTSLSVTLPGGTLGPNGSLAFDFLGSTAATATNRLWSLRLAASAIGGTSNFSGTTTGYRFRGLLHNRSNQSAQITSGFTGYSGVTTAGGTYYTTVNTGVDQTLDLQLRILDTVGNFMISEALAVAVTYGA